jgi:hypothetical protein
MSREQRLAEILRNNSIPKFSSVIVHYLNIVRVSFTPGEADPPLVVDADTVLAVTIAFQRLQPITPNRAKVRQAGRSLQPAEPFSRLILERSKLPAGKSLVDHLCLLAGERTDHYLKRTMLCVLAASWRQELTSSPRPHSRPRGSRPQTLGYGHSRLS